MAWAGLCPTSSPPLASFTTPVSTSQVVVELSPCTEVLKSSSWPLDEREAHTHRERDIQRKSVRPICPQVNINTRHASTEPIEETTSVYVHVYASLNDHVSCCVCVCDEIENLIAYTHNTSLTSPHHLNRTCSSSPGRSKSYSLTLSQVA